MERRTESFILAVIGLVSGCSREAPIDGSPVKPPIVHANGLQGKTDDGNAVTLVAIGRPSNFLRLEGSSIASRIFWKPNGEPLMHEEAILNIDHPMGILTGDDARAVAFTVDGSGASRDAIGYVPDGNPAVVQSRLFEREGLFSTTLSRGPVSLFATGIMPGSSHFMLGLSSADWRQVASRPIDLTRRVDEIVLEGAWGRVRHIMPLPRTGLSESKYDDYSQKWGYYTVESVMLPPREELRLNLRDASGTEVDAYPRKQGRPTLDTDVPSQSITLEVKARRWHWIEFSNIDFKSRGVR